MCHKVTGLIALLLTACTLSAQWVANMNLGAKFTVQKDGRDIMSIAPVIIRPGWHGQGFFINLAKSQHNKRYLGQNGSRRGPLPLVKLDMAVSQKKPNELTVSCTFTPEKDTPAHSLNITAELMADTFAGGRAHPERGQELVLPKELGPVAHLYRNQEKELTITAPLGTLTFGLNPHNTLLIQDNRRWKIDTFVLRCSVPAEPDKTVGEGLYLYKAHQTYQATMSVTFPEPIDLQASQMVVMKQDKTWLPLKNKLDIVKGSALDFTSVIGLDAPAGKHGRTVVRGQDFEFEKLPGIKQRFYGVNLCMGAHDLTHEQSDRLADRLARFGYNTVRFHHHENVVTGFNSRNSRQPNKENLDKIFYLFAALKKRGIYVTTDVYVSRRVTAGEIYPGEKGFIGMNEFKQLCAVNPRARENWKQFAREFLGTVNPYTGLTLAQDPALNVIAMVNEGHLQGRAGGCTFPKKLKEEWLREWNAWILRKAPTPAQQKKLGVNTFPQTDMPVSIAAGTPIANAFAHFLLDTHQNMYRDMTSFMRNDLKCKALFTDMNHAGMTLWPQLTRNTFDYVDHHFYIDHPKFLGEPWRLPSTCPNASVIKTGNLGGSSSGFIRNLNKPFTITEWNYCGPGKYRGIGGIITGCLAAIQNWAGLWRFTYSHSNDMFNPDNRVATYFDVVADPFAQITERATLCLFLRQDLKPAEHTIALAINQNWKRDPSSGEITPLNIPWSGVNLFAKTGVVVATPLDRPNVDLTLPLTPLGPRGKHHIQTIAPASTQTTAKIQNLVKSLKWLPENNITDLKRKIYQTANGQFTVSAPDHLMVLNTPRTAGGFAEAGHTIRTDAGDFEVQEADATVWISSLTQQPLKDAARILLSHVTELHNTNQKYAEKEHKTVLAWGKQPFLVRRGTIKATLKLNRPEEITVYKIDLAGNRIGTVPTQVSDGKLCLTLNIDHSGQAQLLYELIRH